MNDACRNLWAAVLQNALEIAVSDIPDAKITEGMTEKVKNSMRNRTKQSLYERDQARKFITERRGNFDWICRALDIDPGRASKMMAATITNGKYIGAK